MAKASGMTDLADALARRADPPPSRRGRRAVSIYLDEEDWFRLTIACHCLRTSLQAAGEDMLIEFLQRHREIIDEDLARVPPRLPSKPS